MSTFLFVHGIGNRSVAVDHAIQQIEPHVAVLPGSFLVEFCAWGPHLGVPHRSQEFKSIPDFASRGGGVANPKGDAEEEASLWRLLYRDPRFELKLLSVLPQVRPGAGGPFMKSAPRPSEALVFRPS